MAQGNFAASVGAWAAKSRARILAVRNESAQRVVEVMQTPIAQGGNLRVDTGFLRASLVAINGTGLPTQVSHGGGERYTYDAGQVGLVILDADVSDTLTFVYTANYAKPREYGSRGQPGDAFVRLAAQQWGRIVAEVVTEAKARAGT
jgi:hypothetical protein